MRKIIYLSVFALLFYAGVTLAQDNRQNGIVPGQYIVVFNDSVTDGNSVASEMEHAHGLGIVNKYNHAIKGFSATIPAARLSMIKNDPRVAFVSQDRFVSINAKPEGAGRKNGGKTQPPQVLPTGVSRIGSGANVTSVEGIGIAVIDTGIDMSHPDLALNTANVGKTCVSGTRNAKDDNGHGTHVAGIIAALDNDIGVEGVAPDATLYSVKVLDRNGSGTWSSVICGIDWVTENAVSRNIKVANMSLSGAGTSDNDCGNSNNDALHKAICNSVSKGVTYIVAAGNDGMDASGFVPGAYDDAVISVSALADSDGISGGVGGSTYFGGDDTFASFSNYGTSVDIAAPGVDILSTWKDSGYKTVSGTSMATPHVSGAAALFIAANPGSLWQDVKSGLISLGEALGSGHTDPSGKHPEVVLQVDFL